MSSLAQVLYQLLVVLAHKEDGVCKIFRAWGMAYPVPLSQSPVGDHCEFPWIRPSQMLQTMASNGDFHFLLAGHRTMHDAKEILEEFWDRYETICPNHGLFRRIRESGGKLRKCQRLPLIVHGDEGTTYKRNGMLVVQFSAAFGAGSRSTMSDEAWEDWAKNVKSTGIPLNQVKTALQTRFLSFLCPRDRVCKLYCTYTVCFLRKPASSNVLHLR